MVVQLVFFSVSLLNCTYVISPAETVFVQNNVNLHSFGDKDNNQRFTDEWDEFGVCKIPVFNLWLSIVMNILDLDSFRSPEWKGTFYIVPVRGLWIPRFIVGFKFACNSTGPSVFIAFEWIRGRRKIAPGSFRCHFGSTWTTWSSSKWGLLLLFSDPGSEFSYSPFFYLPGSVV